MNELNQVNKKEIHWLTYLVTMVVINGNVCIAEIYHPPCEEKHDIQS